MQDSTKRTIEGNWDQFKGRVKETWGSVTDDDMRRVRGKADRLVGVIKERTGRAEGTIRDRLNQLADRYEDKPGEEEHEP